MGVRESLYDTAKVLSRMVDVIEARTLKHETCVELARWSDVPVINGLTDVNHPTQAICDIFTMREKLGDLDGKTCVFVGDRTNVCSSTMWITTMFGMNFVHAAPEAYQSPPEWVQEAERNVARYGGSVTVTDDVAGAVASADVVYTDLWWWVDQEDEIPERRAAFMPDYQVTPGADGQGAGRTASSCTACRPRATSRSPTRSSTRRSRSSSTRPRTGSTRRRGSSSGGRSRASRTSPTS